MKRSGRATATSKTRAMNASTSSSETVSPLDRALEELRARAETLVPEEAKKAATRTAYASSAGLRFAFFLAQSVAVSRETDGRDLDVVAIGSAVARVRDSGWARPALIVLPPRRSPLPGAREPEQNRP